MDKIDSSKLVFFLGGHDAEMDTIRGILTSKWILQYDKNLTWGAKLSDYSEEIKQLKSEQVPILVELNIDISKPENALVIDHHGEQAGIDKETSIEQVANLLGIKLDRGQQLISANDRGYIPAMKEMGATNIEIEKIRAYDRKCQGATEKDEQLSEQSIREQSEVLGDDKSTILITSLTDKTSCVNDRLWIEYEGKFTDIFIISPPNTLTYSGSGKMIKRLRKYYEHQKRSDGSIEFWSGGNLPEYGYFGAKPALSTDLIKAMVEKPIISQHIFMFPFKIEKNETEKNQSRNRKVDGQSKKVDTLRDKYYNLLKNDGWEEKIYRITDTKLNYNEFVYFHDYIREVLFPNPYSENELQSSIYFEKSVDSDSEMVIHIKTKNGPIRYYLEIDHVALRLFDDEVGILTIELLNYCYSNIDDILKINDFGRRIYPQYLGINNGIDAPKMSFFPDRIEFKLSKIFTDQTFGLEDFYDASLDNTKHRHLKVAQYITRTLGDSFCRQNVLSPVIDDRMFVICWYGNSKLISSLQEWNDKEHCFNYENSDIWYKYVFIDGNDIGIANRKMMHELIEDTTYSRWVEWSTLFGISRYSLVCLTDRSLFAYNYARVHMERIYYQIAVMLLIQRTSIVKFSDNAAEISKEIKPYINKSNQNHQNQDDKPDLNDIVEKVRSCDEQIIRFTNTLCQKEITPQEQGIEIYQKGLTVMEIESNLRNLKEKVHDLFNFVDLANERETSKGIGVFTVINAVFLPLALLASIWGMNLYFMNNFYSNNDTGLSILSMNLISILVFGLSLVFIIGYTSNLLGEIKQNSDLQVTDKKFLVKTLCHPFKKCFIRILGIIMLIIMVLTIFLPNIITLILKWSK